MIKLIYNLTIAILITLVLLSAGQEVRAADGDNTNDKTVITTGASGNVNVTVDVKGKGELSADIKGPARMDITAGQDVKLDVRAGRESRVTINGEGYSDSNNYNDNSGVELTSPALQQQPSVNTENPDNKMTITAASAIALLLALLIAGYCFYRKYQAGKPGFRR
jgi:hypothetical protein